MIVTMFKLYCERFESRSHFKSRLSLIVWVNVVLNRTVVGDSDWCCDNLCGSHPQSQSELYHISWWYCTLYSAYIDVIGQLRHDIMLVICQLSHDVNWLWRLVMYLVHFDPSIVTVKQPSIVSKIVSSPLILLLLSISRLNGAGNCWLWFSSVCSKLVNQISKVSLW